MLLVGIGKCPKISSGSNCTLNADFRTRGSVPTKVSRPDQGETFKKGIFRLPGND